MKTNLLRIHKRQIITLFVFGLLSLHSFAVANSNENNGAHLLEDSHTSNDSEASSSLNLNTASSPPNSDEDSGIFESFIILDQVYDMQAETSNPDFFGPILGTFYCGDQYFLQGAINRTFACPDSNSASITGSKFYYRLTLAGAPSNPFIELPMNFASNDGENFGCIDQTWELNNLGIDLLDGLIPGDYVLNVYTTADYTSSVGSGTHVSDDEGDYYRASFTLAPDIINPDAVCEDFNLVLDANGTGILEIDDINNGSTDNCGIDSIGLSQSIFTCDDLPTAPYTSNEIIISEYVSRPDLNNYLELFNGTLEPKDLSDYELRIYVGAQFTPISTDNLGIAGTLAPNETVVLGLSQSSGYIGDVTLLPNLSLAFQGRETIELYNIATNERVDLFGAIGEYPSPAWIVDGISALYHTLRRLPSVAEGNVNAPAGFPSLGTEWTQYPLGELSGLGSHNFDYNTGPPSYGIRLNVYDETGNRGVCTSTVTFEFPATTASCNDITVSLDANGEATISAEDLNNTSMSGCDALSYSASQTEFDCSHIGNNTVTLSVTDQNGNTTTCDAIVSVVDNISPNAVCQNISISLDETGNATITADDIDNGSNDACGITSMFATPLSFDINDIGENTITLTVTDSNGNVSTCDATVTISADIAPEAVCNDITVSLDSNGDATIEASQIDGGSTALAGIASLTASPSSFDCSNIGDNTAVLTVTDNNGLTSVCNATVTVWDIESPNAICQDATVTLGLDGTGILSIDDVNNGSFDNCAIDEIELSQTSFSCTNVPVEVPAGELIISEYIHGSLVNGGGIFIINNYIEVYNGTPSAIDLANYELRRYTNSSTVPDAVDPLGGAGVLEPGEAFVFSQFFGTNYEGEQLELQNFTMIYNGSMAMELFNTSTNQRVDLIGELGEMPANGWVVNGISTKQHTLRRLPNITQGVTENLPGFPSLGTEWEQFPLDDLSGLGSHESSAGLEPIVGVVLSVSDQAGNISTCVSNVTLNFMAPELSCANTTLYLDETGNAELMPEDLIDNLNAACGVDTIIISQSAFDCSQIGDHFVTLTLIEDNGNEVTCESLVTVADTIAPTVLCSNISLVLDDYGVATLNPQDINNGSFDNCEMSEVFIASQIYFDCTHIGDNEITLSAIDVNGNINTCLSTVSISGDILPVALCTNTTVYLENGQASITTQDIDNGSSAICGLDSISISQTDFSCSDTGSNTVTLSVVDINGNTSTCEATVTVIDDEAPEVACQNITISLDDSGEANISTVDINSGLTDDCGIASAVISQSQFDCSHLGVNNVVLTATDNNGNQSTCSSSVTVIDLISPTAICQTIEIALDGNNEAILSVDDLDAGSTDNCGIASRSLSQTNFDCSNMGENTITLSVTDDSGNVSTCDAIVNIIDTIAPTAICQSALILLDANGLGSIDVSQIDNGSFDNCGFIDITLSQSEFDCSNFGSNPVTMTVTDAYGNVSVCETTVTVIDNLAPNAVGQNLTLSLDENGEASITLADLNNGSYDNCGIATISVSQTDFDCSHLGENTVLMTASDVFGNSAVFTASVIIVDDMAPVLTCQNINIGISSQGYTEVTASELISSISDNCNIASVEITNGQTSFDCDDEGMTFMVEITATDNSGNQSTCSATVNTLAGLDSDLDGISDVCDFCFGDNNLGDADGDGICGGIAICPGTEDLLDYDADCDLSVMLTTFSFQANNGGIYCIEGPFNGQQITVSNGSTVRLSGSGNLALTVQYNSTLEIMAGSQIHFDNINVNWGANAMVVHYDAEVSYDGNFSPNGTVVNCGEIFIEQLTVNYNKTFVNNNIVEITDFRKTSSISGDLLNYDYIHTAGSFNSNWNGEIFNHCHIEIDNKLRLSRNLRNYAFINVGDKTTMQYNGRVHQYDGAMFQTESNTLYGKYIGYGGLNFVKILGNTTISWNGKFEGSIAVCDVDGFENVNSPNPFANGAVQNCDLDIPVSECNPIGHSAIPNPVGINGIPEYDSNDVSNASISGDGIPVSGLENTRGLQSSEIRIWPNPTNGNATLMFTPNSNGSVVIELYGIDGSHILTVFEGSVTKGTPYAEHLDLRQYENGVYFIRLIQNENIQTKKIVYTK